MISSRSFHWIETDLFGRDETEIELPSHIDCCHSEINGSGLPTKAEPSSSLEGYSPRGGSAAQAASCKARTFGRSGASRDSQAGIASAGSGIF